jgi:malate synthase
MITFTIIITVKCNLNFYLPKIQTPYEALIIEKIISKIESKLGLNFGTL